MSRLKELYCKSKAANCRTADGA